MSTGNVIDPVKPVAPGGWEASLNRTGPPPPTIIDVGAAMGTGPLLRAFPDAYHVLIEPQPEFEEALCSKLETRRGEVHPDGRRRPRRRDPSPRLPWTAASDFDAGKHQADSAGDPSRTHDDARPSRNRACWRSPFGLKIDTEGADHLVVRGATNVLRETRFVIAEVWVKPRFVGAHTVAEFIALMDARGFELRDILGAPRAPATGELLYLDALFTPSRPRLSGLRGRRRGGRTFVCTNLSDCR